MKKLYVLLILISASINAQEFVPNELLIKIKENQYHAAKVDLAHNLTGVPTIDALDAALGIKAIESIGQFSKTKTLLLKFNNGLSVATAVSAFGRLKEVDYAEPNYIATIGGVKGTEAQITPADTYFYRQWGLVNNGTLPGVGSTLADADVDMEQAWDIETGDPNLIIAVCDSGLRMIHPDIAARIWTNANEIPNGIDDDLNGLIDDVNGWDWANNDNDPTDDNGHGTNCAGIIGAIPNNNLLYSGANWNSRIMALKCGNSLGNSSYANMANSIYYANDNGAKIISMSIGGTSSSTTLANALIDSHQHNALFVCCMMNTNNNVTYYPAGYSVNLPNVMAVGSTNPNDKRTAPFFWDPTSGSNYGNHINVVAPGNFTYGLDYESNTNSNSYWGGTSQATPLVAAIASLLLSVDPTLSPLQLRSILENTAEDQVGAASEDTPGWDQYMGYGRVNAFTALQSLVLGINSQVSHQELTILNPSRTGDLQLNCKGAHSGSYWMTVYDMSGKLLTKTNTVISQGINPLPFNYSAGNYIVSFDGAGYSKVFKVLRK